MANLPQQTLDDITAKLKTVKIIKDSTVQFYEQEDLLNATKRLSTPCVGIVYLGMRPQDPSKVAGLSVYLTCNVYLIGAERISKGMNYDQARPTLEILNDMRFAIVGDCKLAPGLRKWEFVSEVPVEFTKNMLAYQQTFRTKLNLTNKVS